MTISSISNIEKGIHDFNMWIKEIKEELKCSDQNAYTALQATLQTLRDRLTVNEAVHLGAQLPIIIKGVYYDKWKPADKPEKLDKLTFTSKVHNKFNNDPDVNPENFIQTVFYVIQKNITNGEIEDIKSVLPPDIANLFNLAAQKEN